MLEDAAFWATVGLILFLAVVLYLKVPAMLAKTLDERAAEIRNELEEARKLREEAQELMAEYQRRRKAAEREAEDIIEAARHEAQLFAAESARRTEEMVARRTTMAEEKIARAEAQAMADVRSAAIDVAIAAAERVISDKVKGPADDRFLKNSIEEIKSRLQ